ncbi:hypothetical protein NBRC116598_40910 [Pseudophaeobacter arcticus]|uniref:Uncharacterized protein n=1 Tax=Pseudophaeobacter arcticus TaxID=385492 RepID=A0ABQ0AS00_9RHOB
MAARGYALFGVYKVGVAETKGGPIKIRSSELRTVFESILDANVQR